MVVVLVFVVVVVTIIDEFLAAEGTENTVFKKKESLGLRLVGELQVGLEHMFVSAVNIQVVGVGGGNDGDIRIELEERAVVFVGLDNDILTLVVNHKVAVEVLTDAAKKSATAAGSLAQQVCDECRSSGFSVTTSNGDALLATGEFAKHLRAFLHTDAAGLKGLKFAGVGRNSRSIDYEVKGRGDEVRVVFIVNSYAFGFEFSGKRTGRTVIAADGVATTMEIACQRAHTNASYAQEIVIHHYRFLRFSSCWSSSGSGTNFFCSGFP